MKKLFKILLAACVLLVVLCVTVVLAATIFIDPNEYKGEIARLVREKTGRNLSFEGDIALSFFPYVGLSVGPVGLGNAPGFADPEMVRIKKAEVSLDLVPLVSGKVSVGKLVLDGLSVHLDRNAAGVGNWEDLAGSQSAETETASSAVPAGEDGGAMSLEDITVQGVEITDANLVYTDSQKQAVTSIGNLNLKLGAIHGTDGIPFELGFDLVSEQPRLNLRPRLSGDIRLDPAAGTVALDGLALSALDAQVTGRLEAGVRDGSPHYAGALNLAETSLRKLLEQLGATLPETSDPSALERFSAALQFAGTADSLHLESLTAKLDDTTLSAQGSVADFAAPRIAFAARLDAIDVDRYLPPRTEQGAAAEPEQTTEVPESAELEREPDLGALRNLALDARLDVGGLKVENVKASDIRVDVGIHDGVLVVSPLSLALYGGRFKGRATLDAGGPDPVWTGEGSLKGVQTHPLLRDLLGKDVLRGLASMDCDLTGSGLTGDAVKASVCGNVAFSVTDGSVIGLDVAKMIRDGWNKAVGGDAEGDGAEAGDFEYSRLSATATLKNGHVVNDDLVFDSPLVEASGAGWADLSGNSADYKAMVTVVGSLDGLEGEILDAVRDVPLPLRVTGRLDQPSVGLDGKAMGQLLVTAGLGAGLDILADGLLGDDDDSSLDEDEDYDSAEYDDQADSDNDQGNLFEDLF